jgi:hypothetical protein
MHLASPLLRLLQALELAQQDQLVQPEQLLRMVRTAMPHEHSAALQMVRRMKACGHIQQQQLVGLVADALRTRSYQAAVHVLRICNIDMLYSNDVEQLLLVAIEGMRPSSSGLVGHDVCASARVALKLSQLPGLAQLSLEQLAVVLRAAIQHQTALLGAVASAGSLEWEGRWETAAAIASNQARCSC